MIGTSRTAESIPVRRVSPARQVLTLFGDYWWGVSEALPTGALVGALGDLGVKEAAARAALARLVDIGLLTVTREGRRTAHRLSGRGAEVVQDEARWLDDFGVNEPEWDGLWSVVAFSIPESQRALRHSSRSRLRWLGFAPLYDGLWISPQNTAAEALAQLSDLGVADVTAMRASLTSSDAASARSAWDLDQIVQRYDEFAVALRDADDRSEPKTAFATRSRLMLGWQSFREVDPGLPLALLPERWPRSPLRRWFGEVHEALRPASTERMSELVASVIPELGARVTVRSLSAPPPTSD